MAHEDREGDVVEALLAGVAEDWRPVLEPHRAGLARILARLDEQEAAGVRVLPERPLILRALRLPLAEVRVLIIGQDPYPTPGHAIGLAFAVDERVRPVPRSLRNIQAELQADLGLEPPGHGDLSAWTGAGVLLLNRSLTVAAGRAGAHARLGWGEITEAIVAALAARGGPLVAILWGRSAQELAPLLEGVAQIASAHPSPLSARRGFFGSRPFSAPTPR